VKRIMGLAAVGIAAVAAAVFVATGATAKSSGTNLKGAGSSFVSPLVLTMVQPYEAATGVHVDYNPVGSGAGIAAIQARQVDFGASDAPMTPDQFNGCNGCVQIPWQASGTSISYNLAGAPPHLKITGPVLANIYLGKVTQWNDPSIAALNPGVNLPATTIRPVFRSDSSGDTYAFSDFLAKASPEWKAEKGVSTQVNFTTGVGGKGNDGVAAAIEREDGTIGYLAISYVFTNKLDYALIRNQAGKFPVPGPDTITAAADAVKTIPADNAISITNPPASAANAYPISTFTYAIFPTTSSKATALSDFVTYAIGPGQKFGAKLHFAPLPAKVVSATKQTLAKLG